MLKIAIDKKPLETGHAVRGVGVYTRNLLRELENKKNIKLVDFKENPDIRHYPYFDLFFSTLPFKKQIPTIVTIHDVIPLIYPKYYPPGLKGSLRFLKQKYSLKSVKAIITDSETSKKDIVRLLNVEASKIYVIHLAPDRKFRKLKKGKWQEEIKEKYNLPENFVLYVGDANYNKNILTLIKACKILDLPLIIVGKQFVENFDSTHPENCSIKEVIDNYGSDPGVKRIGFIPISDLVKIYNLADVYCQPSFYEGFGLPVLEALASGTPTVVSRIQSLVEIGEGSCLFADPKDPKDFAENIKKFLDSRKLRSEFSKRGFVHVEKYSWKKVADETVKIYEKVFRGS